MFGNLGFGELMIVLVIVLVLFGAKRIPEISASFGKGIREFKKNVNDVERSITEPESRSEPRLPAGDPLRHETTSVEEVRPEPKRLI
jgi:sec-independent protein translocase protein TatA